MSTGLTRLSDLNFVFAASQFFPIQFPWIFFWFAFLPTSPTIFGYFSWKGLASFYFSHTPHRFLQVFFLAPVLFSRRRTSMDFSGYFRLCEAALKMFCHIFRVNFDPIPVVGGNGDPSAHADNRRDFRDLAVPCRRHLPRQLILYL